MRVLCVSAVELYNELFEIYAVKTSKKANMHNRTGLNLLVLCTLEAQEVTTNGVYRLPCAIYLCTSVASPCQTLCVLLAGDHE